MQCMNLPDAKDADKSICWDMYYGRTILKCLPRDASRMSRHTGWFWEAIRHRSTKMTRRISWDTGWHRLLRFLCASGVAPFRNMEQGLVVVAVLMLCTPRNGSIAYLLVYIPV